MTATGLPAAASVIDRVTGDLVRAQVQELAEARQALDWVAGPPAQVANAVLYRLDDAYRRAFDRIKRGQPAGFPRFRSGRKTPVSLSFPSIGQSHRLARHPDDQRTGYLILAKLGALKFRSDLPLEQLSLGELTLFERAGRWWGSIVIHRDAADVAAGGQEGELRVVGIDRGITDIAATSDGRKLGSMSAIAPPTAMSF